MARLDVGCAMWAHRAWPGRHLPAGLTSRDQLRAYATWCTAVEGNTTFYAVPSEATVAAWAAAAPDDFRFWFKLPRTITHERRLRGVSADVAAFAARLAPLGARAELLVVQLPATFGPGDLDALEAVLARPPAGHRWAVEVRHPAFFAGGGPERALVRLLERRRAEWMTFDTTAMFAAPPRSDAEREAWDDKPRLPRRQAAIGDRPVVRLLGRDDPAATVAGWHDWLPVVTRWLAEGRRPTVFVHTPDNVDAPALARRFHAEVVAEAAAAGVTVDPLPAALEPHPTTLF